MNKICKDIINAELYIFASAGAQDLQDMGKDT
jgi:hypothetical protein